MMPSVDRQEDVTAMSFEDASFDFIYCSNVLEHVIGDRAAMAELFRVLVYGGRAIIQVPIRGEKTYEDYTIVDPEERTKHFGQADHIRFYGSDIQQRLEKVGFEVSPFYMLDILDLSDDQVRRMNLNKRELIHECRKPSVS